MTSLTAGASRWCLFGPRSRIRWAVDFALTSFALDRTPEARVLMVASVAEDLATEDARINMACRRVAGDPSESGCDR